MSAHRWMQTLCEGSVDQVLALYTPGAVLLPTYDDRILRGHRQLRSYFEAFTQRPGLCGRIDEVVEQGPVHSGIYTFRWRENGRRMQVVARFTFVFTPSGQICTHHSSVLPA